MTKLNVNVNDEVARYLINKKDETGVNVTEQVRRAVSVLAYFEKARAEGKDVQLVDKHGYKSTVNFLF